MELLEEILSSRRVGYRRTDPNRGGWEDMGIETALQQPSLLLRYKKTMQFILQSTEIDDLRKAEILDTGEFNPLSQWLKNEYNILVNNTDPDLDFDYVFNEKNASAHYDFIFAFEILEHLMNPLAFVEYLSRSLKPDGKIFLTTPFSRPRFLWSKYHFTEYFPDKIEILANKAGLHVLRYATKNVYPIRAAFSGIRPIFRAIRFERIMLFEMEKMR